jgi:hypothetical protein
MLLALAEESLNENCEPAGIAGLAGINAQLSRSALMPSFSDPIVAITADGS